MKRMVRGAMMVCGAVLMMAASPASAQNMPAYPAGAVESQSLLARPDMTDEEAVAWASQAAVASMTFSYKDYQQRLKNAAGYFTEEGWKKFSSGMVSAQFLDIVVAQKRSLIATASGQGTVVQTGLVNGGYAWHIVLPMALYYTNDAGEEGSHRMNVSLIVARSDVNKDGRGIADWGQVAVEKVKQKREPVLE